MAHQSNTVQHSRTSCVRAQRRTQDGLDTTFQLLRKKTTTRELLLEIESSIMPSRERQSGGRWEDYISSSCHKFKLLKLHSYPQTHQHINTSPRFLVHHSKFGLGSEGRRLSIGYTNRLRQAGTGAGAWGYLPSTPAPARSIPLQPHRSVPVKLDG